MFLKSHAGIIWEYDADVHEEGVMDRPECSGLPVVLFPSHPILFSLVLRCVAMHSCGRKYCDSSPYKRNWPVRHWIGCFVCSSIEMLQLLVTCFPSVLNDRHQVLDEEMHVSSGALYGKQINPSCSYFHICPEWHTAVNIKLPSHEPVNVQLQ